MNRAFQIILAAESISALGSQITIVALPITAVLLLHATPLQMGLLSGSEALPGVLFGLFAGVAIDKLPKRRVLILANLTSALVLGIVPASHALKLLSIFLLGGVNFVATGVANAEGIALMSYLPAIVESDRLAAANGQFSAARSITQIAGPALAGLLVAALSAPGAIAFDALTFLIAVLLIFALPMTDAPATLPTVPVSTLGQLKVGFQFVYESTSIRRVVLIAAFLNFFFRLCRIKDPVHREAALGQAGLVWRRHRYSRRTQGDKIQIGRTFNDRV